MRTLVSSACALAAFALLGGCADYGPHERGGMAVAGGYGGYYDDYYGPYNDGYWGDDGAFYYSDRPGHFNRDDAHHFRRDEAAGYHPVRTHAAPATAHPEGHAEGHPDGRIP